MSQMGNSAAEGSQFPDKAHEWVGVREGGGGGWGGGGWVVLTDLFPSSDSATQDLDSG